MWFFPAALLAGFAVTAAAAVLYNRLVRLRNSVAASWSDIGVLLKKRYDLVENLVETVKGYAAYEKTTLANLTEARSLAASAVSPAEKSRAEGALGRMLGNLVAVAESYPDLKANTGFLGLLGQLRELEDQLEQARRSFNSAVRDYNTLSESFPSNVIAGSFGFTRSGFFEPASPAEATAPRVTFKV